MKNKNDLNLIKTGKLKSCGLSTADCLGASEIGAMDQDSIQEYFH